MEHRREFIENRPYSKQIDEFLDKKNMQKRPQARKPIFLGLESENFENMIPKFESFEKYMKCAHDFSVLIGSYDSPNGLTRVQNIEKSIWVKIQKHCKNAVINQMVLQLFKLKTIKYGTF